MSEEPFRKLPFSSSDTLRKCLHLEMSNSCRTLFIASYPKSGTTWTHALVFHILSDGQLPLDHISLYSPFYEMSKTWDEGSDNIALKYSENHKILGWRVFNTHLLHSMLPKGDSVRHIYVYRNCRDVAISFFHHLSNQVGDGGVSSSLLQFLIDWCDGNLLFGTWANHLHGWLKEINGSNKNNILLLRYEDMKLDLRSSISRVSKFLDHDLITARLDELTLLLNFESMKSSKHLYQPISVEWKEGFEFLRKGEVGDSEGHFGPKEELLISKMLEREFPDGLPEWLSSLGVL